MKIKAKNAVVVQESKSSLGLERCTKSIKSYLPIQRKDDSRRLVASYWTGWED